ncbi:MAG: hypothetical protein JXA41_03905 [Deltaproteobacteria bacterium]|nr:hypothetical protein [Deltaproteobacteria bacterium]
MALDDKYVLLMDQNYLIAMGLLMSNSVAGEFYDSYRFGIFHSGVAMQDFNVVFIKRKSSNPKKLCDQWEHFFTDRNLPFRVVVTPNLADDYLSVLLDRGYKKIDPLPVMALFNMPDRLTPRPDLVIKEVRNPKDLGHFQETAARGFSLPEGSGPFVITDQIMNWADCSMFVGYCEDQPVCTSMLIKTGPVAGVYWVSTIAGYRERGFGRAVTEWAVLEGKNKNCNFACLQASKMGKPIYEKIGFDNSYHYSVFSAPS